MRVTQADAEQFKEWELQQWGKPSFYATLTAPCPSLSLDDFRGVVRDWAWHTWTKPEKAHVALVGWSPVSTHANMTATHPHLHLLPRVEGYKTMSEEELKLSWTAHCMREGLPANKLQCRFDVYDPRRSRLYFWDHHEFHVDMVCPRGRACRKGCWFDSNPKQVGDGWLYKDQQPKR